MTAKKQSVKSEINEKQLAVISGKPAELYKVATDVAGLCREIVKNTAIAIKGKKYVKVEGWEAIAAAHGFVAGARDVERIDTGWKAVGELRRISDGVVIATAEGFVGDDEPTWAGNEGRSGRAEYAIRAMAQTRAISRVCRSAFAHVVVLIDSELSTTPAEEMPFDAPEKHSPTKPYEEKTVKEAGPKSMSDLMQLSAWLNENNIPEGFVLAMLKEKKLISPQLQLLGNAPPGVIRRTLQSRERLLKAFQASNVAAAEPKQSRNAEDEDQSGRWEMRKPVQDDISPQDLLEQEGHDDWRSVVIHFGKKSKGTQLGKLNAKSLVWWITEWHPTQYNNKWSNEDLLLDAALCCAHAEMAATERRNNQ